MTIFDQLREKYGSHEKAARALGVSSKTYFNWKKRGILAPQWMALAEKMRSDEAQIARCIEVEAVFQELEEMGGLVMDRWIKEE